MLRSLERPRGGIVPPVRPVVLFTCAGQRVDIVTAFARAGATTLAVDAGELAPALYAADRRALVPRVDDPGYIDALRALVELHDVRLIVPLADLDHRVLAERRDALGALVLLPGPETIGLCEDKYEAHRFFEEQGIATPPTWLAGRPARRPALSGAGQGPRRGFGSRHIYRAADRAELDFFLGYTTAESMVQQACAGEEFSIDVFCDLDGRCLNAIPRTMIESKGGESIKGMTIKDAELIEHGRRGRRDDGDRRAGEHPVLPRGGRLAAGHRRQPALRRRLPRSDGGRVALPRARARARERRAAGAAARRVPGRGRDDEVLLAGRPPGRRRHARAGDRARLA